MPLFDDPEEEVREQERADYQRSNPIPPDDRLRGLAVKWADKAWWMRPAAAVLLSQAGIDPDSDTGRQIMRVGVKAKGKSGLGFHTVGEVVRKGADAVSNVADFVTPEAVEDAVGRQIEGTAIVAKAATRYATAAFQAGAELVDHGVRETVSDIREEGVLRGLLHTGDRAGEPSAGDILREETTLGQHLSGESMGSGFFPGGDAMAKQAEAARRYGTINGEAITLGRVIANAVVEPGTTPYRVLSGLVDASMEIYADPASLGLGAVGKAAKARRLFDAGAVTGVRNTVLPEAVDAWLTSPAGRSVRDFLRTETDATEIWKRTNKALPARVLGELADATTDEQVDNILRPILGIDVREKPTLARLPDVRRRADRVRLLQEMPGTHIDINDKDAALETLDSFQRNARLPEDVIRANNRALIDATTPQQVFDVVISRVLNDAIGASLKGRVGEKQARQVTKAWRNYHDEFAKYFVDEIGENAVIPGAVIDGAGKATPTPHLYVEYLHNQIPLPDARNIRRAASRMGRLADNGVVDFGISAGDWFMQEMWKPMTLLRGAWTVRVVGEEQFRMAASGLSSLVRHPVDHIALIVGKKGKAGITGDDLFDSPEGLAALAKGSAGFRTGNLIRTRYKTIYERGDEFFAESWADELAQLAADPIGQRVARLPLDEVKRDFWEGTLRKFRKEMADARPDLLTRAGSDAYVDSVLRRLQIKTGDNPELLDAVGSGRFVKDRKIDKKFLQRLDELVDEGVGPVKVKGDQRISVRQSPGAKATEKLDRATEAMFAALMSKPTNTLSRSPAFRQFYWQRVEELLPQMDAAAQAKALDNARKAKAPNLKRLEDAAKAGTGSLDVDDVDLLSKGFGLDQTRRLLYDLSKRSQFFDINRLLFPFGEAWKELLTTWARIGVENPQTLRRLQQTIQGARSAGFFYTNQNGEEVFAYPGTAWLNEKIVGAPIPFEGRVQGLSVMTEVLPGFGPIVQIPAAELLPEQPTWDWVREIVLPFGEKDEQEGFIESHLPAWLQKLRTSGYISEVPFMEPNDTQLRLLNNTAFDLLAWEVSSGKRPRPSTHDELQEAIEDNMEKARWLFLIRAGAQFGAPTAPSPAMVAADADGNVMLAQKMRDDYYALSEEDPQTAFQRFMDKYGESAFLVIQGKSQSLAYAAPVTTDGVKFEREHPDLAKRYKNTFGLFAPQTGDFDFEAYSRQFRTGQRQALTPEQAAQLANARLAQHIYEEQKAKVGPRPSKEQQAWLRQVKDALIDEFPGFGDVAGVAGRVEPDEAIRELRRALNEPVLADTDAGQGLALYLKARDMAVEQGETPTSFQTAGKYEATRAWLRRVADAVIADHPGFARMWDELFSRELADPAADTEVAA